MTALGEAYAALNRGDIDGFIKDFDPQIMRAEFEGTPQGGSYQGIAAVREHVLQGRSTWAEGSCEPERFIVAGDRVVVICHVRVRLNGHTDWRFTGRNEAYTAPADGNYTFKAILTAEPNPSLRINKAELLLKK